MVNIKTNIISNIATHTLEERLDILVRSREALCSAQKIHKQIEKILARTEDPTEKKKLKIKLKTYRAKVESLAYSVYLAQRDYDDKLRRNEEIRKYIHYVSHRVR